MDSRHTQYEKGSCSYLSRLSANRMIIQYTQHLIIFVHFTEYMSFIQARFFLALRRLLSPNGMLHTEELGSYNVGKLKATWCLVHFYTHVSERSKRLWGKPLHLISLMVFKSWNLAYASSLAAKDQCCRHSFFYVSTPSDRSMISICKKVTEDK